jgi:hypothetical protein
MGGGFLINFFAAELPDCTGATFGPAIRIDAIRA